MSENYLVHHGIQGQKWGKKNGPPYPLSDAVSNAVSQGRMAAVNKTTQTVVNKIANKASGKTKKIDIDSKKLINEALLTFGTVSASILLSKGANKTIDIAVKKGRTITTAAMANIGTKAMKWDAARKGFILI